MISGTVFGTALNSRAQRKALESAFAAPPYGAAPQAPVLYIKPRGCLVSCGARVSLPDTLPEVEAAATLGLLFGRDASRVPRKDALGRVAAACLALDVTEPHESYYRPAIRQRCRDGFLPAGPFSAFRSELLTADIVTLVNGEEAHRWSLADLHRDAATLIADISGFMTLAAGDLLLVGLPFEAPRARAGDSVAARMDGLSPLSATFVAEEAR